MTCCCKDCTDILAQDTFLSINAIVIADSAGIETHFETDNGKISLFYLVNFYNKMLKTQENRVRSAFIKWEENSGLFFHNQIICGTFCCYRQLYNTKGDFYKTMSAAIQYNKWKTLKDNYEKRGLQYCCSFIYY